MIAGPRTPGDPAALADVLILDADGRAAADRCTEVFASYPGVSLVVIVADGGTIALGFRNGLRADVSDLAAVLYGWWCR